MESTDRLIRARQKATALCLLRRDELPLDVERLIHDLGIPLVARTLPDTTRGTIGEVRGKVGIVLNRRYQFTSPAERRWVLAEELGHVLLEHRLVESNVPGRGRGLYEPGRALYEREAREFAAELLMPVAQVRRKWLEHSPAQRSTALDVIQEPQIKDLAKLFGVTVSAMKVRLEKLRLI